jgi:transposase
MIPRKPGERIKTDRRDSEKLAILHRFGDLTSVWVPDTTHEALRDLVRVRVDASMHLMRARQQLLAFLLRHGRSYPTGKHWTQRHRCWLAGQRVREQAHGIVFQDYLDAVWTAQGEKRRPDREHLCDGCEMVAGTTCRSTARIARRRPRLRSYLHRIHGRSEPL